MESYRTSLTTLRHAVVGMAVAAALAGCTGSTATVPPPAATTPAATPVATTAPTQAPTIAPTAAPTAAPTVAPTVAPTAAPTATPTAAPTAAPTSPAAMCTGKDNNKAFIAEVATKLKFNVYCAVLPSTWWVSGGGYTLPSGGTLELDYANAAGAKIVIQEGNFCPECAIAADHHYGAAPFDGLSGDFWSLTDTWIMVVGPMANPTYLMTGHGMSKAIFLAWAAAVVKVPKS